METATRSRGSRLQSRSLPGYAAGCRAPSEVSDPAAGEDDSDPQRERQNGNDPGALEESGDTDRSKEQQHLQLEYGIGERARRLADDHHGAGGEEDRQRPPDHRPETARHARPSLVRA